MTTLNLNRESKGYYTASAGNIQIKLCNPRISNGFGTNEWQLLIETKECEELFNGFFDTKKQASITGAEWIQTYL